MLAIAIAGFSCPSALAAGEVIPSLEDAVKQSPIGIPIIPNGETSSPGWALARLNDGDPLAPDDHYRYPETNTPVRLYLIDTAVSNPGNWFDGNENISITTELVSYGGGPTTSSAFKHGTEMLGIIAGPGTGVAQGTPIEVINYDIYPDGEGSPSGGGLLSIAITSAVFHQFEHPETPAIICIAAGSQFENTSDSLLDDVKFAVDNGITVIVSAGNSGQLAENFVPSAFGSESGVICVGASDQSNSRYSSSNHGAAVDFYAPGVNVQTLNVASANGDTIGVNGTSAAAAMTTGSALATLSMYPDLTPAELESKLRTSTFAPEEVEEGAAIIEIVQLPPSDSDGDGAHDLLESFSGTNPVDSSDVPSPPSLTGSTDLDGETTASMTFLVNDSLFNAGNPFELSDGVTWKIKESIDMTDWSDSTVGTLSYGTPSGGKIPVTYTRVGGENSCFLKLEITPAP